MQQAGLTPQAMVEMPSHIQSDFKALLPFDRLLQIGMTEDRTTHHSGYWTMISQPQYLQSLLNTVLLSAAVTLVTLLIAAVVGCFLARQRFPCDSRSSANPRFLPLIICWFLSPGLCGVPRVTIWAISAARSI